MKTSTRKALVLLVKLAVAGLLLVLVFRKVHWDDYTVAADGKEVLQRGLRSTIASADGWVLGGSFLCFAVPMFMLSVRWWYLLRVQQVRIPLREAVKLTFLGSFFNYVVPGMVSGDLVKGYYVFKHTERKAGVVLSLFVDRAVGLLEFAILPALVMAYLLAAGGDTRRLALPGVLVAGVLVAVAAAAAVLFSPAFRRALRLRRVLSILPIRRHLTMAASAAELYRRRSGALLKALAVTFGGQAVFIAGVAIAGITLAPAVPWFHYFLYVPLILIIASVPVSPGGLGVMESFFVLFFASGPTTPPQALALALVARLFPMAWSLPGVVVALTGPRLPRPEQIQAELGGAETP